MRYIKIIFALTVTLFLSHEVTYSQRWLRQGSPILGDSANDNSGNAIAISSDGSTIAIGAEKNASNGIYSGHVRVYYLSNNSWVPKGSEIVGESPGDFFGNSLSLSSDGNTIAISAYRKSLDSTDQGQVRVFSWDGADWVQKGRSFNGVSAYEYLGQTVVLSKEGNIIAIGAPGNSEVGKYSGQTRVFKWMDSSWVQMGQAINGVSEQEFWGSGLDMSSDGKVVAIGSSISKENGIPVGKVMVFEFDQNSWKQKGWTLFGANKGDGFASEIAISGDGKVLAVGSPYKKIDEVTYGSVEIFEFRLNDWRKRGITIQSDSISDEFGRYIALNYDGGVVAISAINNNFNGNSSGSVNNYEWLNDNWSQLGNILYGDAINDLFGRSVVLDSVGKTIAVAANGTSQKNANKGITQIYSLCTPTYDSIKLQSTCLYISPNGKRFGITGTYLDTLVNDQGCDSFVFIDLIIKNDLLILSQSSDSSIYEGESWNVIVSAAGDSFRWQKDTGSGFFDIKEGPNTVGVNRDTLTLDKVRMEDNNHRFRCIVKYGGCLDTSGEIGLQVLKNVGYVEYYASREISLFPNPTKRYVSLMWSNVKIIPSKIDLIGLDGRIIKSYNCQELNCVHIDLIQFSQGIYFLRIETVNHELFQTRFMLLD